MTSIFEGQPLQNKALSNENRGHLGSRCKYLHALPISRRHLLNDSAKIELLEFAMPPNLMDGSFLSCYFFRTGLPNRWLPDFTVQKVIHDEVAVIITRADQN